MLLQTSVMPGECWAVSGHRASAVIKLIASIYVTNISLEHIPKSLSPTGEIDSAPKEFSIWVCSSNFSHDYNLVLRLLALA